MVDRDTDKGIVCFRMVNKMKRTITISEKNFDILTKIKEQLDKNTNEWGIYHSYDDTLTHLLWNCYKGLMKQ